MATMVPRSASTEARMHRIPDLFLSHSSRDKIFVRQLADDLVFCQIDVWLDEWEVQVGDSLHDVIGNALEKSRFIGVVLGDHSSDSIWARDELKQALSREKRLSSTIILPIICGNSPIPAFVEDKVYLDFRSNYYAALARLTAAIHKVSRVRIEESLRDNPPSSIRDVINALRYCGFEPYVVIGEDDFKEIAATGGADVIGDRVRFDPERVLESSGVSQHVRNLMNKLINEVWEASENQVFDQQWREFSQMPLKFPLDSSQRRLKRDPHDRS